MADPRIDELRALLPRSMLYDWVRFGARLVRVLRDRHHAGRHDAVVDRLLERARASAELREWRRTHVPSVSYPPELPISARKDEIIEAIRRHPVVIVAGETGSGKTTQIPKMCLEAGLGIEAKIGCTQPRRVAALSISRRVAEELGVPWGREVGSRIRFDDRSVPQTYIKFVTDGMLLAELQGDPDLSEYNALILDEAHERSLNIDFLLGHLKGLLGRRQDLKLIITSATINTAAFARAFGGATVIEVSGRVYPVEVVHAPLDAESEERGDQTYIDAAVRATEQVLHQPGAGDVLVFLPGERDIREAAEQLEGRFGREVDIIPLYGRLSAGDQQRAFAPGGRTKVVVATNIAETSLTIPGIRYVIDSGLARISRYNARTRTRRLPVEPISQSSARQRQGRAGRVRDGVCIRLYAEADYAERPAETQPEIQRANLAEVILRMKAFHLGDIESFPFLDPPAPAAIRAGYALLHELGALDAQRQLTPLGQDLARLPIDPTLGRMLLRSQEEHATRELLIIASGLSIQDPRERPLDRQEAADAAHRRFADPRSDFLALLNLWNAYHDEWESLRTQNQRRRFCREHFLSYPRMREWQDLHAQLEEALGDLGSVRLNESNADYGAVHRSVLAGLLGHVGLRVRRNAYRGVGNREMAVFPGSVLFERPVRSEAPAARGRRGEPPKAAPAQPAWLVAGEVMETSQVFARTVAGIEPDWIVQLAPHLCRTAHVKPHWNPSAGAVLVEEIITFQGLEVRRRAAAYGNIDPVAATQIFIRSALVEEALVPTDPADTPEREGDDTRVWRTPVRHLPGRGSPYPFLEHNRRVRERIEAWETRLRRHEFGDLDEAMYRFYAARITGVSSRDALNRLLRGQSDPRFLCLGEDDLTGGRKLDVDRDAFPDEVAVGGQQVAVRYAYAPGEEWDGITLQVPVELAQAVAASGVDWAVPGLRVEQVTELLGSLPKTLRRALQPFAPKVAEIVRDLVPTGPTLMHDLSRFIRAQYGVDVPVAAWRPESLPAHLRTRIEVVGDDRKSIAAGRDLDSLRGRLAPVTMAPARGSAAWERAAARWERVAVTGWTFGDLPERIEVEQAGGRTVEAWPGLRLEEGAVCVRLFRSPAVARQQTGPGMCRLVELALEKDLAWLERDLRGLARLAPRLVAAGAVQELQETALVNLKRHVLGGAEAGLPTLTEAHFSAAVARARERVGGLAMQLIDRVTAVLQLRQQVEAKLGAAAPPAPGPGAAAGRRVLTDFSQLTATAPTPSPARPAHPLAADLARLVPPRFLERVPFERLADLPRYLKALLVRAERRALSPAKDTERLRLLAPYEEAWRRLASRTGVPDEARPRIEAFRWLLEEYRVSLFAQELGTAVPVSPKRLDEELEAIRLLTG